MPLSHFSDEQLSTPSLPPGCGKLVPPHSLLVKSKTRSTSVEVSVARSFQTQNTLDPAIPSPCARRRGYNTNHHHSLYGMDKRQKATSGGIP